MPDMVKGQAVVVATVLLSATSCAPKSKIPALADFDAVLHPRCVLRLDPTASTTGLFEIAQGDRLVLEFHAVRGKSLFAHDTEADWRVAVELPPAADPSRSIDVNLDGVPVIARVAGESVLYLARKAKGRIALAGTSDAVTGEIDILFERVDRDLIKLGTLRLVGTFSAKTER